MNEANLKKINSTQTITNALPAIIEAFVTLYGESEREVIEQKFKNLLVIGYSKPSDIESIITADKKSKSEALIDKFLNDIKVPEAEKKQVKELFFSYSTLEHLYSHPIYLYILYKNGDTRNYYKNKSVEFLSKLYPSLNITTDNLDELMSQGKFQDLESTIELYNTAVEEYQAYLKQIEPYTSYIEKCKQLEKNLDKKYTKMLIDELQDLFTEEELEQIEKTSNDPYASSIYYLNNKTKNLLGYNLGSAPLIESFNLANEEIMLTGNKWQRESIQRDRVSYFKNLGIDLGDDYEAYMTDPRVQAIIPSKEIAQRVTDKRNEMYTQKMNEFYQSTLEYQQNRAKIDELDLVDKDDGYDANSYENSRTCISTNIKKTDTGYIMYPILYFYINNYNEYLDPSLIHELNHVYELHLEKVEDHRYYGTCGWDVIDSVISQERSGTVSLEDRKEKRNYELFNEIINELISQEICQILFDSGHRIFSSQENTKIRGGTSYESTLFMVKDFYQTYKKEIFDSRKNGDMTVLFDAVGKENFEALNELFHVFYEYFPGMKSFTVRQQLINKEETELTKKFKEIVIKVNTILNQMEEHSKKRATSL